MRLPVRYIDAFIDNQDSIYAYNDNNAYDVTSPSQYSGTRLTVKNQIMVNPGGSLTRSFPQGATVTLVEELTNSDYHFENWTDNNSNAGSNEIYTISNIAAAHTVVANFAPNSHTITIEPNNTSYGSVSQGSITVPHGATITTSGNTLTVDGTTVIALSASALAKAVPSAAAAPLTIMPAAPSRQQQNPATTSTDGMRTTNW